jgi:hypothetical protein
VEKYHPVFCYQCVDEIISVLYEGLIFTILDRYKNYEHSKIKTQVKKNPYFLLYTVYYIFMFLQALQKKKFRKL